ncbi:MAG: tetratricopeptide repeat protein, partial [Stellaceae bacterium]
QLNDKSGSMLRLGDASRQAGDCGSAVRFYRMVKDRDDNKAELAAARIGAADCELSMNALPDAERDYREAAKLTPKDPTPQIGLGRIAVVSHKPGEAIGYLDMAIKKGADAPFVWNDQGVAYDQLRRHKEAQAAYRAGLAKYPSDRALRNNLALSLAMTGDFHEAESLLRVLAADPAASRRTRQNLALVLGLAGNTEEARNVAQPDLDGAALDNNSRFYQYAHAMMTGDAMPLPAAMPTATGNAAPRAAHAEAVAPLPPPVLVQQQRLTALRPAAPSQLEAATIEPPPAAETKTAEAKAAPAVQTAALPPLEPAAAKAPAGAPTRIVAHDRGALKTDAANAAKPVASSE